MRRSAHPHPKCAGTEGVHHTYSSAQDSFDISLLSQHPRKLNIAFFDRIYSVLLLCPVYKPPKCLLAQASLSR